MEQPVGPPILRFFGHMFFTKNEKILKTAILTLGMNILTVTMVKNYSRDGFRDQNVFFRLYTLPVSIQGLTKQS